MRNRPVRSHRASCRSRRTWSPKTVRGGLGPKPNAFIALSGWLPRYFPPILVTSANTLLREKLLFGSDRPMTAPKTRLADFQGIAIRDALCPLILKDNAARLLRLSGA